MFIADITDITLTKGEKLMHKKSKLNKNHWHPLQNRKIVYTFVSVLYTGLLKLQILISSN